MKRLFQLAILGCLAGATMACEPVFRVHGFAPQDEAVQTVEAGVDTRGSVRRKVGRPSSTGIFTDQGWYYVSTTVKHEAFYEPTVVDRKVVAITFDPSDVVATVDTYGLEDGRIVNLQTRVTPTAGRGLTILEQLFANIGVSGVTEALGN